MNASRVTQRNQYRKPRPRGSRELRLVLKKQRHYAFISRHGARLQPQFLKQVAEAMVLQAVDDAEILGRAAKIKLLNDLMLWRAIKWRYNWSKNMRLDPEKEIGDLVKWSWGQQYGFIIEYLGLTEIEEAIRCRLEELMHIETEAT